MIKLKPIEKKLILIIKGYFQKEYPFNKSWAKTLSPFCIELFGWDANEDNNYDDYLRGILHYLLKLHKKIEYNKSGDDLYRIHELLDATIYRSIINNDESPIERAITYLCGVIQHNPILDDKMEKRYDLTITPEKIINTRSVTPILYDFGSNYSVFIFLLLSDNCYIADGETVFNIYSKKLEFYNSKISNRSHYCKIIATESQVKKEDLLEIKNNSDFANIYKTIKIEVNVSYTHEDIPQIITPVLIDGFINICKPLKK